MKFLQIFFLLFIVINSIGQPNLYNKPSVSAKAITKDFNRFWNYYNEQVNWYSNYKTIDTSFNTISKDLFFNQLIEGNYIPLKIIAKNGDLFYQLTPIPINADTSIAIITRRVASERYWFYKLEGINMPKFNFFDIKGNSFNASNTKGKIVVINCWYTTCAPCIKEMPVLNEIVKEYQNNSAIVFLGLVRNSTSEVSNFLNSHRFDYAQIADVQDYLDKDLQIRGYPTHIILNTNGKIEKVISGADINVLKNTITQLLIKSNQ